MRIKVYSGLTLSEAEVRTEVPQASWAPPVRRGDVSTDIEEGIQVVGIIDGEFFQSLSVTPSEILEALRAGVMVYGAGSMGAMRAAELDVFGMIGCGRIYERIRESLYFPDDHLGVAFDPADRSQVSLPMVDFHATVDGLVAAGRIVAATGEHLRHHFERLHFTERHLGALSHSLELDAMQRPDLAAALDLVRGNVFSQKRSDGFELLHRIRHDMDEIERLNTLLNA